MIKIEKLYGDGFFKGRKKYNWRMPIVCGAVVAIMEEAYGKRPESACDVGAAIGDLVQGFVDLGLDAYGIEGSEAAAPYLVCAPERMAFWDLRKPLTAAEPYDVVTCFEVAEHLEPEYAETFVDSLTGLSDHLVMSACPPNPDGRPATKYHLNEQPREYWEKLFQAKGFKRSPRIEAMFLQAWHPWRRKYGIAAFHQNFIYFEKA